MKKITVRSFLAFLAVLIIVCFVACEKGSGDDLPNDSVADTTVSLTSESVTDHEIANTEDTLPVETTGAPIKFTISSDYTLIRPAEPKGDEEIKALELLSRGIKSACKTYCRSKTDFISSSSQRGEFEILVGATNRAESRELSDSLKYRDWAYTVVSPNVIAICGGSPEATYEAVKAFLSDVMGYSEREDGTVVSSGHTAVLEAGMLNAYYHEYQVSSLKIGNRDIGEYTLVVKDADSSGIETVIGSIERLTGESIKVVKASEFSGGPAIYFGCVNTSGDHLDIEPYGKNRYYVTERGEDIIIDFKSKAASVAAAECFMNEYMPKDGKGEVTVSLGRKQLTGIYISEGTNSLVLDSVKENAVAVGITYEERLYYDPDGKPVRAYILTVEKGAGVFYTSTPNDEYRNGKVSSIYHQIKSAEANGKKVIAGINADFFDIGGTNIMSGLCIKDGVLLKVAGNRPWVGALDDGTVVMGDGSEYAKYADRLVSAVGGSNILMKNDVIQSIAVGTDFGDTRHPRTAVGTKADGSVVFMVVDGRQSAISNGASLADLAEIFASLGCCDAINLDGGGSSTFILKNSEGKFVVENSPSGGALRAVANGFLVLEP